MLLKLKISFSKHLRAGMYIRLFLCIALAAPAAAQSAKPPLSELEIYRRALHLETAAAENAGKLFGEEQKGLSLYAGHLALFLKLTLKEDAEAYAAYAGQRKALLGKNDELDDSDPFKGFVAAEIYLQSSIIKAKYGSYLGAAWDFRKAYILAHEHARRFPAFKPVNKTLGVVSSLALAVPAGYQWVLPLVGMPAPAADPLAILADVPQANPFHFEAAVLSALIQLYLKQEADAAVTLLAKLEPEWSASPLFNFIYALALAKDRQGDDALKKLLLVKQASSSVDYVDYLAAEIYLQKAAYREAIAHYDFFIQNYQGKNYLKDAAYKKALCFYLMRRNAAANKQLKQARSIPASQSDADQYAERQLEKNALPNRLILQLRFYTDGGYFEKADSLVAANKAIEFDNFPDEAEWIYRQARLIHLRGSPGDAVSLYRKVIHNYPEMDGFYIQPNSALQLGYIFKARQETDSAVFYLKKAMEYKNHPYKNGIDSKARVALKSIK